MRKAVRLIACVLCFILVFPSVSLPVFAYTSLGEVRAQEAVVQEIQDQVDSGSLGFFRANNGEESEAVQTILSRIETQGGDQWGTVNPGVEGDATNLENFRIAILMIIKGNELRAQEELFPGLEPLRVSDYLMALSEIQTSASKNLTQHSQMFNVGECLGILLEQRRRTLRGLVFQGKTGVRLVQRPADQRRNAGSGYGSGESAFQ